MDNGTAIPFGTQLRRLREAAGLSQEELAEAAGLARNAISALERGERRRPYPDTVRRLAEALRLDDTTRSAFIAAVPSRNEGAAPETLPPPAPPDSLGVIGLPEFLTTLVGREDDLAALHALLLGTRTAAARLLTLTGPGGVGKTRLAAELARLLAPRFPDGVIFVPLAPLEDAALVLQTVAQAIGLRDLGATPAAELLTLRLRTKRMLLILDNFEHVISAAAEIGRLILSCPQLVVVVTSRAALRLHGEQEYPVAPLAVPGPILGTTAALVGNSAAGRLFTQRAQSILPSFALTNENAAAVAAVCSRLDGLPLALELAAARVRLLPPAALHARLDRALPLLVGGARDLPARQRTMRDTIAWSHDLLTDQERAVFRRMAVFAGGATLEAAEAVCRFPDEQFDVLPILSSLLDQSLLRTEETANGARLALLQTGREFGMEQLAEHGEGHAAHERHAVFFRDLAETAEPHLSSAGRKPWLRQLAAERDNLRAALTWSLGPTADRDTALRLAGALPWFWYLLGYVGEGRSWLERTLTRWPLTSGQDTTEVIALRARSLWGLAALAWLQSAYGFARKQLEESIDAFRLSGEQGRLALALHIHGRVVLESGDPATASISLREALALYRETGDRWGIAFTLQGLALDTWMLGDIAETRALFDEGLALFQELGDEWGHAVTLFYIGGEHWLAGELDTARAVLERAVAIDRAIGNTWEQSWALMVLGFVLLEQEDIPWARQVIAETLRLCCELNNSRCMARALVGTASIAVIEGQLEKAARLCGAVAHLRSSEGVDPPINRMGLRILDIFNQLTVAGREAVGPERFGRLQTAGRALSMGDAADEALQILGAIESVGQTR